MRLILTFLTLALIIASTSLAGGYKITDVIEVGPAAWVPYLGPLKWSPDGTKLAYFANEYLMVSDTLGSSRAVMALDMYPYRCAWISNTEMAIRLASHRGRGATHYKMIVVDVNTGLSTVLLECDRTDTSLREAGTVYFEGPFVTLEGNAYYNVRTNSGDDKAPGNFQSVFFEPDEEGSKSENHIVRWQSDGLYKTTLDGTESTLIVENTASYKSPFTAVSPDMQWVLSGGVLFSAAGADHIVLDTIDYEQPPLTYGCGFVYSSFNPQNTEILFQLTCEGTRPSGAEFEVDRVGIFDYTTYRFTLLDTLVGLHQCTTPVYGPDGRRIALLSDDKAYIVVREVSK